MIDIRQHLNQLPAELVDSLAEEYKKIHQEYLLGNWGPSQLNGGRFSEILLRIMEYKLNNVYTPLSGSMQGKRDKIFRDMLQKTSLPDSYRFHIPKTVDLILDFRNKRNVAHPGAIDVNPMDASFVKNASSWIMAELIREESSCPTLEAQGKINQLLEQRSPIVEEFGERLKIIDPKLTKKEQILVLAYTKSNDRIDIKSIQEWVAEKNKSRLNQYLKELDRARLIDYYKGTIQITSLGIIWVQKNIALEVEV